jgi:hypothetical protein
VVRSRIVGITLGVFEFLVAMRNHGVRYDRTLTIGRQAMMDVPQDTASRILLEHGAPLPVEEVSKLLQASGQSESVFAEPFLRHLGAREVWSIDASPYEACTIIHDLNTPVERNLHRRFTAVLDLGSLEHVFNFPVAVQNCMEMVAPGGHLVSVTPANNYFGHGFYQFSPELYYRLLDDGGAYRVVEMLIREERRRSQWFRVSDPARLQRRVVLLNRFPTLMYVCAQRRSAEPLTLQMPQQSDYAAMWGRHEVAGSAIADSTALRRPMRSIGARRHAAKLIPRTVKDFLHDHSGDRMGPASRRHDFEPTNLNEV